MFFIRNSSGETWICAKDREWRTRTKLLFSSVMRDRWWCMIMMVWHGLLLDGVIDLVPPRRVFESGSHAQEKSSFLMIRSIQQRAMMPGEKYPKGYIQTHQTKTQRFSFFFCSLCAKSIYLNAAEPVFFFLMQSLSQKRIM